MSSQKKTLKQAAPAQASQAQPTKATASTKAQSVKQDKNKNKTETADKQPKSASHDKHVIQKPEPIQEQKQDQEEKKEEPESKVADAKEGSKTRRKLEVNDLLTALDSLIDGLSGDVESSRENAKNNKLTADLRKRVKIAVSLKADITRFSKQKVKSKRAVNPNTGFAKKYPICESLAKFAGWTENDLKSRTDVFTCISDYVKANNLYPDEKDHRKISVDGKLRQLLQTASNYDAKQAIIEYKHIHKFISPFFKQTQTE